MQEKSENFNSLRPILFELCKKNYRGGQIDPPPSRNRVKRRHTLQLEHKDKYMPCLILMKIKQSLQTFLILFQILNGKITNALLCRGKSLFKRLKKDKMVKLTFSPPIRPAQKIYPPPPELQGFLRQIFALVAAAQVLKQMFIVY